MVSSYRDWVSPDIASHDHHAPHIMHQHLRISCPIHATAYHPTTDPWTPLSMGYHFPHISPSCPDHSPHPKWTTVYRIHPASQRPPPPAFQCCILTTIAYTSPLTHPRSFPHPRSGQRAVSSSQHRAPALADPSKTNAHASPCYLPTTQRVAKGPSRTFDIAS